MHVTQRELAVSAVALCLSAAIGLAQPEAFEVASIKPVHYAGGPLRVKANVLPAGINFENVTLRLCIQRAYAVKPYQVTGPEWINTERYTIVAKAGGPATEERLMRMLATLLADRFKLAFHKEPREIPVYALVVAKSGLKMKESRSEGSEIDGDSDGLHGQRVSSGQLAGVLRQQLDRPVIDDTGLQGLYDFKLVFDSESNRPGSNPGAADDAAAHDPAGKPSIFTAVQEQLGLRLEARRGPVEVIVVDHAEKEPGGN
jgi:uncharacterized protein (TIGR03435 family)